MRLPDAQQKMASALTFRSFQAEQDKESFSVQCTIGYYYASFNTIAVSGQSEYCTIFHFLFVCPFIRSSVTGVTFLDNLMVNP